ncbi:MAG: 6-phosphogluconolactonase [Thioclava marina]|uniref:6-phosphogluconolactonase n=1 Tax=Thioclava marina TaxID=1915077 RepID=A0ABX3MLT5_9RHOB|nr:MULTISPECIES: 6-phosphogluconolactonase [Thioclava]TNE87534.1 MAG: 6-phosphogluconolactonase [Paracoccaceae bacterium]MBC7144750.1 6-phosphogluconolactonase [Thioclava marina]MBD3802841.1 6-phosphogluconolactonase [Thioclava sp.]OOY11134.1 6-phosphogluconolactonase [Thioclava marina]OOY27089.1 6-phosphogluconolactonase [Thioclava sp. L04-15]
MIFKSYPDREFLMMGLADRIASQLRETIQTQGHATFSVPGGTTPGPIFDILSGVDLDWGSVAVLLNDERWVPESSERSNTRLIRERLLTGRAAKATLVPLYADAPRPEDRMEELAEGIKPHLPISVLLLGMGADMHTASLFPGADRLAEALSDDAPILLPMRAEAAGEPRITLSAPVLRDAMHTHILITGNEKRKAIEAAEKLPVEQAPVRAVLKDATVHWAE